MKANVIWEVNDKMWHPENGEGIISCIIGDGENPVYRIVWLDGIMGTCSDKNTLSSLGWINTTKNS